MSWQPQTFKPSTQKSWQPSTFKSAQQQPSEQQKMYDTAGQNISTNPLASVIAYGANAMQNIPFADEVGSGIGAALGIGKGETASERYDNLQQAQQVMRVKGQEINPTSTAIGDVSGALATMAVPVGKAMNGTQSLGKMALEGMKIGAPMGAAYGAGNADSFKPDAEAVMERAKNMVGGAVGAAAIGASAPYAIKGAMNTGSAMSDAIQRMTGNAAPKIAPEAAILAEQLSMDKTSPQALAGVLRKNKNQPLTLSDIGGENLTRTAENTTQTTGEGMADAIRMFQDRNVKQPERINQALSGLGDLNYIENVQAQQAAMKSPEISKAYTNVFNAHPKVSGTEINKALSSIESSDIGQQIMQKAQELAKRDKFNFTPRNERGAVRNLSLREIDYIKKAGDDLLNSAYSKSGSNITKGDIRYYSGELNKLRSAADDATGGAYKKVRDMYGDPARDLRAGGEGRDLLTDKEFFNTASHYTSDAVSEAEQQAFKSGYLRSIQEKLKSQFDNAPIASAQNAAQKFVLDPAIREKTAAVFGEKQAAKLLDDLALQAKMQTNANKQIQGSQTFQRQAKDAEITQKSKSLMEKGLSVLNPRNIASVLGKNASDSNKQKLNNALAKMLNNPDYAQNMRTLAEVSRSMNLNAQQKSKIVEMLKSTKSASELASPTATRLLIGNDNKEYKFRPDLPRIEIRK